MRPRQEIVEIFSSFLKFSSTDATNWVTDSTLYQNMLCYLKQSPSLEQDRSDWVLFWYKIWLNQPQSLARGHLYAYLQEVGYKAASKIKPKRGLEQYTLGDFFQIAIAHIDQVLKRFDPVRNSNLEKYAYYALSNLIKEGLQKEGLEESNFRGEWSLLQVTSEKKLQQSLQRRGLSNAEIERYILAWECFKIVYVPNKPRGNRQLPEPDSITWEKIAQLYNQERLAQLSASVPLNGTAIQQLMKVCIQAIRDYITLPKVSLDAPLNPEGNTLQDIQLASETTSLEQMIDAEEAEIRRSLLQQINSLLNNAVTNIEPQTKELLEMYYGEGLTQKEIALKLNKSQPTVSRRLRQLHQLKAEWVQALAQWVQTTLNISLTPDVINHMSSLLDEWLQQYYINDKDREQGID